MNQLAVSFYVVPVMGMTMTGCGLFVFFVWLRRLLRLPLSELALALLAFVEGLDVGQETPGYSLDLILGRDLSRIFLSQRISSPDESHQRYVVMQKLYNKAPYTTTVQKRDDVQKRLAY